MRGVKRSWEDSSKKKVYDMVKYMLKSGSDGSRFELVAKEISVANFILDFRQIFSTSM